MQLAVTVANELSSCTVVFTCKQHTAQFSTFRDQTSLTYMKKAEKHMYDEANMDGAGQYLHTFAMTYFPLNLITSGPLTYLLSQ